MSVFPCEIENIALKLLEDIATPVSLATAMLLKYKEYDQLALRKCDPGKYIDHSSFWSDNVAVSLLRKCADLPTSFDRKANAVANFWKCEKMCLRTNLRLSPYLDVPLYADSSDVVERFIVLARKKIKKILGECPADLIGRFGPGATYGDKGCLTTVPDKMTSCPTFTPSSLSMLPMWSKTAWARACVQLGRQLEIVHGNRFSTVPKDAEKLRGIAIEPSVNLFYQLGIGRLLKKRLRAAGLDLQYGQDIHRQVACEASIRGHLATIDLSNASDTICKALVKLLLPPVWFQILNEIRSPKTNVDGKWVVLEKFSSMGNGYTFELETLIFSTLASCALEMNDCEVVLGANVHTFGDDIIVPTDQAKNVIAVLQYFGMETNKAKTFVNGPFRESCGGDYFNGVNVRPYHLEEFPCEPQQYIAMANGLRRLASSVNNAYYRDATIRRAWFCILDAIPSDIRRLRGPQDLGDLVIHDDHSRWSTRQRNSIRYINVWRPARFKRVGWIHFHDDVVLASALYGTGDGAVGPCGRRSEPLGVTPRDAVIGYKKGWVPFS